jgi:hypothetical protein
VRVPGSGSSSIKRSGSSSIKEGETGIAIAKVVAFIPVAGMPTLWVPKILRQPMRPGNIQWLRPTSRGPVD